jgi:hypothetical protein
MACFGTQEIVRKLVPQARVPELAMGSLCTLVYTGEGAAQGVARPHAGGSGALLHGPGTDPEQRDSGAGVYEELGQATRQRRRRGRVKAAPGLYDDDRLTRDFGKEGGGSVGRPGADEDGSDIWLGSLRGSQSSAEASGRTVGWSVHILGDASLVNKTNQMLEHLFEPYPYAD